MKEVIGDIWDYMGMEKILCCTCNEVVKSSGELVMGAGIAKDFARKYRYLP